MSNQVEAEVQWLRDTLLPKLLTCGRFIENYQTDAADTFKVRDVKVNFIGAEEAFMLTTCYRATIAFEYDGVPDSRAIVVKKTPRLTQEMFDAVNYSALFGNEIHAYETIIPAIEEFAGHKLVIPKFYYGELRSDFGLMVLEDFGTHGWETSKARYNLSLEHVLLAVKYLAKFHGTCFALRHKDPARFKELTGLLKETRYATSVIHPDYKITLDASIVRLHEIIQKHQPQVDKGFLNKLTEMLSSYYQYGKKRVQPVEPLITLCHGDYLRNNVAYKYGQGTQSDTPQAVMMFDLQTVRESSPMVDLVLFLMLSAFTEVRNNHFKEIFSSYCGQLAETFKALSDSELPEYLSEENLLKEYIGFMPHAISIGVAFLPVLVEVENITSEELLMQQRTEEDLREEAMTRGGELVDKEVAHQVKELYELSKEHNVDVFKGFSTTDGTV